MEIVIGITGALVGAFSCFLLINIKNKSKSNLIIEDAKKEAEQIRKEKILQAKEKFIELKAEHEKEIVKKK